MRSNVGTSERRFYVLALDDENVPVGLTAEVRKAAHAFVRRVVQPGDVVAVVTSAGLSVGMREFTEDMSLVEAAIDRYAGNRPPGQPDQPTARPVGSRRQRNKPIGSPAPRRRERRHGRRARRAAARRSARWPT